MSNKRKLNSLDPTKINNYNKFLITLDKNEKLNNTPTNNNNNNSINNEKKENKTNQTLSEKELKELIEYIFGKYDSNNLSSSSFT